MKEQILEAIQRARVSDKVKELQSRIQKVRSSLHSLKGRAAKVSAAITDEKTNQN